MYDNITGQHSENRNAITVKDKYPAIDALGFEATTLDNKNLGGIQRVSDIDNAKFNGCIYEHHGKRFICYRAYSHKTERSAIFVSVLDGLEPQSAVEIELPSYNAPIQQYEDARFFSHLGDLYLSYVIVEYTQTFWAGIHVVKLNPHNFEVVEHFVPSYDRNCVNNAQKNWIFFSEGGSIRCIFDTKCHEILTMDDRIPDVDDPATKGCLQQMLRTAKGDETMSAHCSDEHTDNPWYCEGVRYGPYGLWPTEAEAMIETMEGRT